MENTQNSWTVCLQCQGRGKKSKGLRKKVRLRYQRELALFQNSTTNMVEPIRPKGHLEMCASCKGTGLLRCAVPPSAEKENYPHVAIIGGGIGGVALAVACLHRGIPFTLFERDKNFEARSQGYGLTLQQASRAIEGLGISTLKEGIVSTRHVVHTIEGKMIGEWGIRKWGKSETKSAPRRTNIHIARQSLRQALLEQLGGNNKVQWDHQLVDFKESESDGLALSFQVDGQIKSIKADLMVGADGVRSSVRRLLIGDDVSPLNYLGCIVILGICPLVDIKTETRDLLDTATVFQTANGNERIYIMPFKSDSVMWQLSFPICEDDAKVLSIQGPEALKQEAIRRCQWHDPIPQILQATLGENISGYPAYDRALISEDLLEKGNNITLIGDAAHPMSPFKGQGANQALLDALALARGITKGCGASSRWEKAGIRERVLKEFETEMIQRSAIKVKGSADAAKFLHSDVVLHEGNEPRGRCLQREESKEKEADSK